MKNLKKKLFAATTMMLLAAVMLSSVSYAWFTLSTNPEITGMSATVSANENLEIALDNNYADGNAVDAASRYPEAATGKTDPQGSKSGNPYTWGNLVDLTTAFTSMGTVKLQPVKYTANETTKKFTGFQYPKYGNDGRVDSLAALNPKSWSDHSSVTAPTAGGVVSYSATADTAPLYAYSVAYWLRTNETGAITLNKEGTERADDEATTANTAEDNSDVNTIVGKGSYIMLPDFGTKAADGYTEAQLAQIAYVSNIVVKFHVDGETTDTVVNATLIDGEKTDSNGLADPEIVDGDAYFYLSATVIDELARNTAQKVTMYVYLDGETITNADALLTDIPNVGFNIQFQHSGISLMEGNDTNGSGSMTGDND